MAAKTNVIKCRFIRQGEPSGREYTYFTNTDVAVGDMVDLESKEGISHGVVTAIDVPEAEIAPFKDRAKTILGKTQPKDPEKELTAECSNTVPNTQVNASIPMFSVKSSMVDAIGYDRATQQLHVLFKGGNGGVYKDVPKDTYDELMVALSVGSYIGKNIRSQYEYVKNQIKTQEVK